MNWLMAIFIQELKKLLMYRLEFWINFLGQTFFSITISYSLWATIYSNNQTTEMQGYNLNEILIYYIFAPLLFRLVQGENIGNISRDIYEGSLSKYLVYPISFMQYKTMTYLAYSAYYYVQMLLFFIICKFFISETPLNFFNIIEATPFLIISCLTYFALTSIIEQIAYWADNIWSLSVLMRFCLGLFGGSMIPLAFFPEGFLNFLKLTPFPYFIHVPLKILTGETDFSQNLSAFFILFIWYLLLSFISHLVWNRGKYIYQGAGM
jgi:ABC-2 type transport system permease protein